MAEAVRLLDRLFELCPTGGPLHVVVEDWNIDDHFITPMYEIPARGSYPGYPDNYSAEVHEVCDRLAAILSEMPVGWRGSVLAHQDGRAVKGTVVRRDSGTAL